MGPQVSRAQERRHRPHFKNVSGGDQLNSHFVNSFAKGLKLEDVCFQESSTTGLRNVIQQCINTVSQH